MSEEQYEQVRLLQEQNEKLKKENKSLNAYFGVILEITTIGGSHIVGPVLIRKMVCQK